MKSITHQDMPVLSVGQNFGYPKVIRNPPDSNAGWHLMLTKRPEAYMATGVAGGAQGRVDFTLNTTPVISPGVVSWAMDEHINPALGCEDTVDYNFKVFIGGRSSG